MYSIREKLIMCTTYQDNEKQKVIFDYFIKAQLLIGAVTINFNSILNYIEILPAIRWGIFIGESAVSLGVLGLFAYKHAKAADEPQSIETPVYKV
jgi:hypothetical protein